jgi:hypothetical protein
MAQKQQNKLNSLAWWKNALANGAPAINSSMPPARGWYRQRRKGEQYRPCAYWYDDKSGKLKWSGLRELVDKQYWTETDPETNELDITEEKARDLWLFIHKHPISYETYEAVTGGAPWPDIDPTVAAASNTMMGHNNPPSDPVADYAQKIDIAEAGADKYSEIVSDEQAAQAQTLRAHLLKLHGDADKLREAEKKPFFEQAKAVDSKWQPLVKKAKTVADKIRAAIADFETKKLQAKAAAADKPPAPDDAREKPAPIPAIKGAIGRAAIVRTRRVATAITNLEALLYSIKSRPEFEPLLLTLAQKILDENGDVLGVSINTVAEVR